HRRSRRVNKARTALATIRTCPARANEPLAGCLFVGEGESYGTIALVAKADHPIGRHDDLARSPREGPRFGGLEPLYEANPEGCPLMQDDPDAGRPGCTREECLRLPADLVRRLVDGHRELLHAQKVDVSGGVCLDTRNDEANADASGVAHGLQPMQSRSGG